MRKTLLALLLVALLLPSCSVLEFGQPTTRGAHSSIHIAAWNNVCGSHHFDSYPQPGLTFAQCYHPPMLDTTTADAALDAAVADMEQTCGDIPDLGGNDLLSILANL